MRWPKVLAMLWLIVPLAVLCFHRIYGQELVVHDQAAHLIRIIDNDVNAGDWPSAASTESRLLSILPDDALHRNDRVRAQVAMQVARSHMQQGVEAISALKDLVYSTADDRAVSEPVRRDIRTELAQLDYYVGWRMRLEGSPQWVKQVESAREQFQLLAKTATVYSEKAADIQNMESAIRLERMDLSELRATPLPRPGQHLEPKPSEKQQSNGDDDQPQSGPESPPPDAKPDDAKHGTGGNSGGKYGRPLKGS